MKQKFALFGPYYLAYYYHDGGIIKQIMTNPSGDRDTISLSGFRGVWKNSLSPLASPRVTDYFSKPP